jgi:hypothetical protein
MRKNKKKLSKTKLLRTPANISCFFFWRTEIRNRLSIVPYWLDFLPEDRGILILNQEVTTAWDAPVAHSRKPVCCWDGSHKAKKCVWDGRHPGNQVRWSKRYCLGPVTRQRLVKTDWEGFTRAVVNCIVGELTIAPWLLVVKIYKFPVNAITNPDPVYSHFITWQ